MDNQFFEKPILNSPYEYPTRHWELDAQGQPTQRIIERRRAAEFITPIPKPRKRKNTSEQLEIVYNEGKGLSTEKQQYDTISVVNTVRGYVDLWRSRPDPNDWQVTPETARLLKHWRHHRFNSIRPFFCQIEAVETAIWLMEVAPKTKAGKDILEHLVNANNDANPGLLRLALKLATRRRQDHRHGNDYCLANHKCCAPAQQQKVHPRVSGYLPRLNYPRPAPRTSAERSVQLLPEPGTRSQ